MISVDKLIDDYNEAYGVTYELVAKNKAGEVIAKRTSSISADDVSGFAWDIDEAIKNAALGGLDDKEDLAESVAIDNVMEALYE